MDLLLILLNNQMITIVIVTPNGKVTLTVRRSAVLLQRINK